MPLITWGHSCYFCHRQITRGKPTILFAADKPLLIGISHSTCGVRKTKYGHHQLNPPDHLSPEQIAFLIQYFPLLYRLPGGFEPNSDLRRCVADFHWNFPAVLTNPMKCVHDFLEKNQNEPLTYEGDLEADYIEFLAKVQKAAKKNQWMLSLIFHEVSAKPFSEHI